MGSDQETRMGATFEAWAIPEEGEWPKRDAVPVISAQAEFYRIKNWQAPPIGQRPAEVTPEMNAAGDEACALHSLGVFAPGVTKQEASYRAMHALAPVGLVSPAERQVEKAYCYLRGLFEICAPNSTPLPDLIGLCTQIDNVIAGLRVQALPSDDRGNPFHFVMDRDGSGPQLWMRTALDDWFLVRPGWSLGCEAPEVHAVATNAQPDRLPAGYRYLGPATWRRPAEPLGSPAEIALIRERDEALAVARQYERQAQAMEDDFREEESKVYALRADLMAAHDKLATAENTGNHDYHGPTEEVPHPTIEGRTERRAVPDVAHEQFHRAVGDVLAGKIMPKAREQMRDALSRSSPDAPTTASTSRPMPGKALGIPADPRRLGLA